MKIAIMTDMEGVAGVINSDDWVKPGGPYYDQGKALLTEEVNAAIRGFAAAGADTFLVLDGHGSGGIDFMLLDSRADLQRGFFGPAPFGLDATFDAMAWVGQHAKAGTEYAHLPHTGSFDAIDMRINGVSVGEFGQMALYAEELGVANVFGCGDAAFCAEARALVAGIKTAAVKRGLVPGSGDELDFDAYRARNLGAVHMHPLRARALIEAGAREALTALRAGRVPGKIGLTPPYRLEAAFRDRQERPARTVLETDDSSVIALMNRFYAR